MRLVRWLLHWAVSAAALMATALLVPGFHAGPFRRALAASVLIALMSALVRPLLWILTLPINLLTLGLFTFVVNGAVLKLCAALAPGWLSIDSWPSAVAGALVLCVVSAFFHFLTV